MLNVLAFNDPCSFESFVCEIAVRKTKYEECRKSTIRWEKKKKETPCPRGEKENLHLNYPGSDEGKL